MTRNRLMLLLIVLVLACAAGVAVARILRVRRTRRRQRRRARHIDYQRFWDKLVPRLRAKRLTYRPRKGDEPPAR